MLMMQRPTSYGTSTNHLTVDMVEQNISSASHPRAIFQAWMWDLIKHINKKPFRASIDKPPQPIK